jgi:phospholipid/cholesterol/gamma-HCH transport system substrate-binding protein
MYVTVFRPDDPREMRRLVLSGVAFIVVIALLVWLSIAIYNKTFIRFTTVTVETSRAGLQLARLGDVRYHGVVVGQVRDISQTGDKAIIELGLDRDLADTIPSNVNVEIVPTTLFGAKYVSLVEPEDASTEGIRDGTVITADRVSTSTELNEVLADLFPLLRAVAPADLSRTLTALATALNGRGEALGTTLSRLHEYLAALNTHLPTLRRDLELLDSVARTYVDAAPDLLSSLDDLSVTANTVFTQGPELAALLNRLTSLGRRGSELLAQNEDLLDRTLSAAAPVLGLLAKYAPQHYCLLMGFHLLHPLLNKVYEGGAVKQNVRIPVPQVRAYDERDVPEYGDQRGPRCYGLPFDPPPRAFFGHFADGTDIDTAEGRGPLTLLPGALPPGVTHTRTVDAFMRTNLNDPTATPSLDLTLVDSLSDLLDPGLEGAQP